MCINLNVLTFCIELCNSACTDILSQIRLCKILYRTCFQPPSVRTSSTAYPASFKELVERKVSFIGYWAFWQQWEYKVTKTYWVYTILFPAVQGDKVQRRVLQTWVFTSSNLSYPIQLLIKCNLIGWLDFSAKLKLFLFFFLLVNRVFMIIASSLCLSDLTN